MSLAACRNEDKNDAAGNWDAGNGRKGGGGEGKKTERGRRRISLLMVMSSQRTTSHRQRVEVGLELEPVGYI